MLLNLEVSFDELLEILFEGLGGHGHARLGGGDASLEEGLGDPLVTHSGEVV